MQQGIGGRHRRSLAEGAPKNQYCHADEQEQRTYFSQTKHRPWAGDRRLHVQIEIEPAAGEQHRAESCQHRRASFAAARRRATEVSEMAPSLSCRRDGANIQVVLTSQIAM